MGGVGRNPPPDATVSVPVALPLPLLTVIASGYESSLAGRSSTGVVGATVSCVIANTFETGVVFPARSV